VDVAGNYLAGGAGGLIALLVKTYPLRVRTGSAACFLLATGWLPSAGTLGEIFLYFAKAAIFVFGSGLAVVPFLYGGVVQGHHWLTPQQFVDAVAVAMITPGPVVITVAFIGYLVAGWAGATAAAAGMFLPVYLVVVLLAPSYKRWSKNPQLKRLRARRHRRGHRSHRRLGFCSGAPLDLRLAHLSHRNAQRRHSLPLEGAGARAHCNSGDGRTGAPPGLTHTPQLLKCSLCDLL
jgi:hypothetical protein